jgi:hypothetical protein
MSSGYSIFSKFTNSSKGSGGERTPLHSSNNDNSSNSNSNNNNEGGNSRNQDSNSNGDTQHHQQQQQQQQKHMLSLLNASFDYVIERFADVKKQAERGPLSFRVLAFLGGCGMVFVAVFNSLGRFMSFSPLQALIEVYVGIFGLMIIVLEVMY